MTIDMTNQQRAFLTMLRWSEGTSTVSGSDDGYNVLVGGHLFSSYAQHPNILVQVNPHLESTAAGAYQELYRFWIVYQKLLGLPDFGHDSQDACAIQQIKERSALDDIEAGNIEHAITRCSNIWASLPGNTYGQQQRSVDDLLQQFVDAGGIVA